MTTTSWLRQWWIVGVGLLTAGLVLGCQVDDEQPPVPNSEIEASCKLRFDTYLIDAIDVPMSAHAATTLGVDVDGDELGRVDNATGQLIAAMAGILPGFAERVPAALQQSIDEAGLVWLLRVGRCETGEDHVRASLHRLNLGINGGGISSTSPAAIPIEAIGARAGDGSMRAGDGLNIPVPLSAFVSVDASAPVQWVYGDGMVLELAPDGEGGLTGKLGIGLRANHLDAMAASLATQLTTLLASDPQNELARYLDADHDGAITAAELTSNEVVRALATADVDLAAMYEDAEVYWPLHDGERDRLSLGIGIHARPL